MKIDYCHNNKKQYQIFSVAKKKGEGKYLVGFFFGSFEILAHKLKQTHVCCSLFLGWGIYWEIIFLKPNK
jgi:hypothetical protein